MSRPPRTPEAVPRSVLSDATYTVVRNLILDHDLEPGTRVNIDALAARLEVSPTPLREALARLESDGLVVKQPLRGYSTTPLLSVREFSELIQLRLLLEGWTAARAAERVAERDAERLRAELAEVRSRVTSEPIEDAFRTLTEHDARLHLQIARLAGNDAIAQAFERTHFHLHFLRLYLAARSALEDGEPDSAPLHRVLDAYEKLDQVERTIDDHERIVEAVIAGDAARAATLMREHIEVNRERFLPVASLLG